MFAAISAATRHEAHALWENSKSTRREASCLRCSERQHFARLKQNSKLEKHQSPSASLLRQPGDPRQMKDGAGAYMLGRAVTTIGILLIPECVSSYHLAINRRVCRGWTLSGHVLLLLPGATGGVRPERCARPIEPPPRAECGSIRKFGVLFLSSAGPLGR
jgi:hypothetical protein